MEPASPRNENSASTTRADPNFGMYTRPARTSYPNTLPAVGQSNGARRQVAAREELRRLMDAGEVSALDVERGDGNLEHHGALRPDHLLSGDGDTVAGEEAELEVELRLDDVDFTRERALRDGLRTKTQKRRKARR